MRTKKKLKKIKNPSGQSFVLGRVKVTYRPQKDWWAAHQEVI